MSKARVTTTMTVRNRSYKRAKTAANAVAEHIMVNIDNRMSKKHGEAWYHIVGVDHIWRIRDRAYRRVLPICSRVLP